MLGLAGKAFGFKSLAFGAAGALAIGFAIGGWLAWEYRDSKCDAAFWKKEAELSAAKVEGLKGQIDMLNARIEERDEAARNHAERTKRDEDDRKKLRGAILELASKVRDGSCFEAGTIDWLRRHWPSPGPGADPAR
jgi:hypothetical protein